MGKYDNFLSLIKNEKIDTRDSDELVEEAEKKGKINKLKSKKKYIKYAKMHFLKIAALEELLNFPKKNEQIRIVTQGSFNSYTIILAILQKEKIEELHLTTFNIKETVIDALFDMLEQKQINFLSIIISESVNFRMPKRVIQLKALFEKHKYNKNVRVKLNWNHSKIMLIKTEKNFYCIEGSGNLSDNAQVEQYVLDNNKEVFDFHKKWIDEEFIEQSKKREEIWK